MEKEFKNSVLQALAYFDTFDHPLSAVELYKNLWGLERRYGFYDFLVDLKEMVDFGLVEEENGYYFFPGREDTIDIREHRVSFLESKMKIAQKATKIIRFVPFVRGVFVCNTLASATHDHLSDIDLFIVIKHGRLWFTRLLITIALSILGMRRHKEKINNRICLSFFITDKNLNLQRVSLENDVYLYYWITQLIPIYDAFDISKKILKENDWVKERLYHFDSVYKVDETWQVKKFIKMSGITNFMEKIWGSSYGDLLEKQAKAIGLSKMRFNSTSVQKENDSRVVINDEMLKFHENDRREFYKEKWKKKCEFYDISE